MCPAKIEDYHCDLVWENEAEGIAVCTRGDFRGRISTIEALRRCRAITEKPDFGDPSVPRSQETYSVPEPPPWYRKAINLAKAVIEHFPDVIQSIRTGDDADKYRSDEEIRKNLEICKSCELFDGTVCTHESCGCPMDAERPQWYSALAWKSKSCPIGRW